MNRNNFWRCVLVLLVLLWSVYELYPPKSRPLIEVFRDRAQNRDAAFNTILGRAAELQKAAPQREYDNLKEAVGTNDLNRYFPFYQARTEEHQTAFILNRLQRESLGKIRLAWICGSSSRKL